MEWHAKEERGRKRIEKKREDIKRERWSPPCRRERAREPGAPRLVRVLADKVLADRVCRGVSRQGY